MSTNCENIEENKITQILNTFDANSHIEDLAYYHEILDLMRNYDRKIKPESTANILILLNSMNRSDDIITNYKHFDQLDDEEKLTLKSILGAII